MPDADCTVDMTNKLRWRLVGDFSLQREMTDHAEREKAGNFSASIISWDKKRLTCDVPIFG
ncbi:hypothetical protein LX36DRAFT_363484 [Colletotrichum falcatum]|nr:hypothetical protein LX36DRAFT_363484 [Colletotrichum falcatum]